MVAPNLIFNTVLIAIQGIGAAGEAIFFHGTLQKEQLSIFKISGGFDLLFVRH